MEGIIEILLTTPVLAEIENNLKVHKDALIMNIIPQLLTTSDQEYYNFEDNPAEFINQCLDTCIAQSSNTLKT